MRHDNERKLPTDPLRDALLAESARSGAEFDGSLHDRVMRGVRDAARDEARRGSARSVVSPRASRTPWWFAGATMAGLGVAVAVSVWRSAAVEPNPVAPTPRHSLAIGITPLSDSFAMSTTPFRQSLSVPVGGLRDNVRLLGQDVQNFAVFLGERLTLMNVRENAQTGTGVRSSS